MLLICKQIVLCVYKPIMLADRSWRCLERRPVTPLKVSRLFANKAGGGWLDTPAGELPQEETLVGLAALNRELVTRVEAINSPRHIVLDMDSTEVAVYGQQEESA
jgi:hypothetical protein